ncbi:MAG: RidA family protein [Proteobacteria bacterium]|nr:RidA family protein [Pseudomonadota bacterium]
MKEEVFTLNAPDPIGPYSQAIKAGKFLFLSGQIPLIPETGQIEVGDIKVQMERVMKNISAILESADMNFDDVVKVTIYLRDLSNFSDINEIYERYFKKPYPARSTVEVKDLPKGSGVEIDIIAYKD